ncbi:MAG: hypothetical protein M3R04_07000 [bacterium]|nr:hypothetical protein [bacterium]
MAKKLVTVGDVTVTTAGTRVRVTATETQCESIIFQGHPSNTGYIYFGDTLVSATRGTALEAKQAGTVAPAKEGEGGELMDLSDFWVDASVNGEKVKVSYIARR